MILFLERLRLRRERKLHELECKHLQKVCPHDYYIVRQYRESYDDWVDAYCPMCDKTKYGIRKSIYHREEKKKELREMYSMVGK